MIQRTQNPLRGNSFFLFGARGSGKSTLLKALFGSEKTLWIDLLDPEQENRYALRPAELRDQLAALEDRIGWVVTGRTTTSSRIFVPRMARR